MRIGEILLRDGIITEVQLRAARRVQERFGERLGSTLVQIGYLDADTLARALGRQHGVPAVVQKHLASVDADAVKLMPARLVERYLAIPLGFSAKAPKRLIVAMRDPALTLAEELAFAIGHRVEPAVVPEVVLNRLLERIHGIRRGTPATYLQAAATLITDEAQEQARRAPTVVPPTIASPRPAEPPTKPSQSAMPAVAKQPSQPAAAAAKKPSQPAMAAVRVSPSQPAMAAVRVSPSQPASPARTSSLPAPKRPSPTPPSQIPPPPPTPRFLDDMDVLSVPPSSRRGAALRVGLSPPAQPGVGLDDALRAIAKATTPAAIGDAVVEQLRAAYGCGLVLILRDGMARGWKGFTESGAAIETIAVPISAQSVLHAAWRSKAIFHGTPPPDGAVTDRRFFEALGAPPPLEVIVGPVVLDAHVTHLVYAHALDGGRLHFRAAADMERLCAAAADGWARLIQEA